MFKSTTYEWLIVDESMTQIKGIGKINGFGEYEFIIIIIDAERNPNDTYAIDRFRIKIWVDAGNGDEIVVYDNGIGEKISDPDATTEIGCGEIVIHK